MRRVPLSPQPPFTVTAPAATARWWRRPVSGRRQVTVAPIAFACLLSAALVLLVIGKDGGSAAAAAVAVTMTAPVAYARLAPSAAGLSLAAAAGLNELSFGHIVRCAAALPAAFYVAFFAGYVLGRRGRTGLAGVTVSVVLQCVFDPRLGTPVIALMVPVELVFFCAGLYLRRRAAMTASLRMYTAQLREQRDRTAALAVAAEREDLTSRLNATLRRQIDSIALAVDAGDSSHDRFVRIEQLGRQTLNAMRELLGSLLDSPTQPEPGLADLAGLCARSTAADVRLTVDGEIRPLPASIELSACRIVEQLLLVLTDEPATRVQLRLDFAAAGLDIAVYGAPGNEADLDHVQALARARAALHGGTVDITDRSGQRRARVWLPLITAHG